MGQNKKLTLNEFILKSKSVHGDKYQYNNTNYINTITPVIITCPIHGDFSVRPSDHIHKKCGCKKCSGGRTRYNRNFYRKSEKNTW